MERDPKELEARFRFLIEAELGELARQSDATRDHRWQMRALRMIGCGRFSEARDGTMKGTLSIRSGRTQ
ncbi:MAG: hypothetical protein MEQ84_08135 [Mesorhizobium sp.]|nr:hypothetical protein [Mesorhizobium sp.]